MNNQKLILGVLAIAILGYVVFKLVKGEDDITDASSNVGSDTKPLDYGKKTYEGKKVYPTITKTQARTVAKQLHSYMDKSGTDEMEILKVLVLKNGKSLQKIFTAFGKPKYFISEGSAALGDNLNLFQWFEEELSGKWLLATKNVYRKANLGWK